MTEFKFDLDKFQDHYNKLCPCLIPNRQTAIKANLCPCLDFIAHGKCRCGLFIEVEKDAVQ